MPKIERYEPNIYWLCTFCNEKVGGWPIGAQAHLDDEHSPINTNPTSTIRSLILPDIGDEEDKPGRRFDYFCPFCYVSPTHHASFEDKSALKQHLVVEHGCS